MSTAYPPASAGMRYDQHGNLVPDVAPALVPAPAPHPERVVPPEDPRARRDQYGRLLPEPTQQMMFLDRLPDRGGNRAQRNWREVADRLRARPGHWAIVGTDIPIGTANAIRGDRIKAFRPHGHFEVATRNRTPERRTTLLMRYVGPGRDAD